MLKKKFPSFVEHFMNYLLPHGPITVRGMFGGFGIFYDKVIFAIVIGQELYFRVNEEIREDFEKRGSEQFVYEGIRKPVGMPYFTLPESILKNPKTLKQWIDRSYWASLNSKKTARSSKIKRQSRI